MKTGVEFVKNGDLDIDQKAELLGKRGQRAVTICMISALNKFLQTFGKGMKR